MACRFPVAHGRFRARADSCAARGRGAQSRVMCSPSRILRNTLGWTNKRVAKFAVRRAPHHVGLRRIDTALPGELGTTQSEEAT